MAICALSGIQWDEVKCHSKAQQMGLSLGQEPDEKLTDRSPDDANVKNKMIFASSKDALRRRLDGELPVSCLCTQAEPQVFTSSSRPPTLARSLRMSVSHTSQFNVIEGHTDL